RHGEYIKLEYKGSDELFVGVDQMDEVEKYVGCEDKWGRLNKLGGREWKKRKGKVEESVEDIVDELIALYKQGEMC
uniref:CarD family transcriptional regulator n=1 Tax=Staphylococcus epidermidis TaxID=1282 RepID=UPI0011A5666F